MKKAVIMVPIPAIAEEVYIYKNKEIVFVRYYIFAVNLDVIALISAY